MGIVRGSGEVVAHRGRGRPGIRDVAERAGVGTASVSRALSSHPDVSDAMRQRVLAAADELGYEPNLVAQGLRRQVTNSVGFLLSDISNPLLSSIVRGAESVLRAADFSMVLTNSEDSPELDARQVRHLRQRRVDGLLLLTAAEDDPLTVRLLKDHPAPLVVIDRELPPEVPASYVLSDHETGMKEAVQHLVDLGHRQIAAVVGRDVRPSRERLRAVREALQSAGSPPPLVEAGTLSADHGGDAVRRLLDRADPPTAIILGGNLLLIGALQVIRELRLTLGRDLSLVSCDDVPLAWLNDPPVSVVARDAERIGEAGAEILLGRLRGETDVDPVVLPTWYEPRASCGPVH